MSVRDVRVGQVTTLLQDGKRSWMTVPTEEVIEALIRLVGVEQVGNEIRKGRGQ